VAKEIPQKNLLGGKTSGKEIPPKQHQVSSTRRETKVKKKGKKRVYTKKRKKNGRWFSQKKKKSSQATQAIKAGNTLELVKKET